ncbi:hypothetical protein ADL15_33015 [Actinoplanes awajinensis subsp. mycoplanecinus]|uniref:Uncharacterized protein n=1 Tax=Actinoplanes awajinensis subsp. mycoplanecinus TaxID=135947 RepID=A0A124G964_9ACTN|nr:hypothetical protein ADL15_33015 [Actinoplanes awajinensis subsp. mycoplanecinus]
MRAVVSRHGYGRPVRSSTMASRSAASRSSAGLARNSRRRRSSGWSQRSRSTVSAACGRCSVWMPRRESMYPETIRQLAPAARKLATTRPRMRASSTVRPGSAGISG